MYVRFVKSVIDRVTAALLLVILSPVLMVGLIVSAVSVRANPIFKHERPGLNAESIFVFKVRTMMPEMDSQGRVLTNVQRITKLGNFLRRTSVDEIPQLVNVVMGDMSLVGPRPLQMWYLPHYTERQNLRHSVKPGITGLAQVNGRNKLSWDEKFDLDLAYVENVSFALDLKILLKTAVKIFSGNEVNALASNTMDGFVERPSSNVCNPPDETPDK